MYILGISAFYHDSAAVLIKDGKVVAAFEEERFTRVKHESAFPKKSIESCLKFAGIRIDEIDAVSYYEKPLLRFERILELIISSYPNTSKFFVNGILEWFGQKIKVEQQIRKLGFKKEIFFIPHHLSHASASYFGSGFKNAAILTVDGVGEYQTTGLYYGKGGKIKPLSQINFPDSLGLLYSTFTAFLGFRVNEDEYKLMGLSAYGRPIYKEDIYKLIDVKEDGSFKLNLSYFKFHREYKMWGNKFEKLFGSHAENGRFTQKHKDIAASIQAVTEEIYFKILNHLYFSTKSPNLCIGGGVALNALANGKVFSNTPFKKVYIIGPSGDGGSAMGAALFTYHQILGHKKVEKIESLTLGAEYSNEEIEEALLARGLKFKKMKNEGELILKAAKLLEKNKVIGWFQERAEFGPRALGNRSILANPSSALMKEKVNKVKFRELFRPFAGSVLEEEAGDYFMLPKTQKDFPFMNFCFQVKEDRKKDIAAIVHKDGTCRIQTVSKDNGLYYLLLKEFHALTGVPVILNTSFNLRGEPIVETPEQAIVDFVKTKMDCLIIGSYIIKK